MKTFIEWLVDKTNEDDLPFDMSKDDVITWVKNIQEILISDEKKPYMGRHYGDCTKQNIPCQLCLYLNWLVDYKEYCISII
jgi:hypothetical protein